MSNEPTSRPTADADTATAKSHTELTEQDLDRVVGGGASKQASGPTESLSLNFTNIVWTYTTQK